MKPNLPHYANLRDGGNMPPVSFERKAMGTISRICAAIAYISASAFAASVVIHAIN